MRVIHAHLNQSMLLNTHNIASCERAKPQIFVSISSSTESARNARQDVLIAPRRRRRQELLSSMCAAAGIAINICQHAGIVFEVFSPRTLCFVCLYIFVSQLASVKFFCHARLHREPTTTTRARHVWAVFCARCTNSTTRAHILAHDSHSCAPRCWQEMLHCHA